MKGSRRAVWAALIVVAVLALLPAVAAAHDLKWKSVATGANHTVAVREDGSLWGWGLNGNGQVGDGTFVDVPSPKLISAEKDWVEVYAGGFFSIAKKADGSLWGWGINSDGQLGNLDTDDHPLPTKIGNDTDWAKLSVGINHTLAIKTDGTLWAWGRNHESQCGSPLEPGTGPDGWPAPPKGMLPKQIGTQSDWAEVAAGGFYSMALKSDGSMWGWGSNSAGNLGDDTLSMRPDPWRIGQATDWAKIATGCNSTTYAIKNNGTLWAWGSNQNYAVGDGTNVDRWTPQCISTATDWTSVSGALGYAIATRADGTIWGWGTAIAGELGDQNVRAKPADLGFGAGWATASSHVVRVVATKPEGSYWLWGMNAFGGVGDGTAEDRYTPVLLSSTNCAPTPVDDIGLWTRKNETLSISFTELLTNDSDFDGDVLKVTSVESTHTDPLFETSKTVEFVPTTDFVGKTWFWYNVVDSHGAQGTAKVVVDVVEANQSVAPAGGGSVELPQDQGSIELPPTLSEPAVVTVDSVDLVDQQPPPPGFVSAGVYCDIDMNVPISGNATVCINYDDTGMTAEQESALRLFHWVDGVGWDDITADVGGNPDISANTITGVTDSLSPFAVFAPNSPPVIAKVHVPTVPVNLTSAVSVTATFTDPDPGDTHDAVWYWGDGTSSTGTIEPASRVVSGTHTYSQPGVYQVTLRVEDSAGSFAEKAADQYVVVFDPSAGFATGGGWFDSPVGALVGSDAAGKATFGFVSKYQKGATGPSGQTQFQFHAGELDFKSTSYDWLTISRGKAQYKGSGTIGGAGSYGFLVTAIDGQYERGTGPDGFRVKIWDKATGILVYDNRLGTAENGDAVTTIGGGDIAVHK